MPIWLESPGATAIRGGVSVEAVSVVSRARDSHIRLAWESVVSSERSSWGIRRLPWLCRVSSPTAWTSVPSGMIFQAGESLPKCDRTHAHTIGRRAMVRRNRELVYALIAIAASTGAYLFVYRQDGGLPSASHLFGHGIGVVGFVLMLMTETLYSLRKRSTSARWGSTQSWLRFHMFTGMVGPYMVLLHPAMSFTVWPASWRCSRWSWS